MRGEVAGIGGWRGEVRKDIEGIEKKNSRRLRRGVVGK